MKRYLYLSLRGGLGNQLFSMCAGVTVANQIDRNIRIDFRNISPRRSSINDFDISWKNSDIKTAVGNSRDKSPRGILMFVTRASYKITSKFIPGIEYSPRYLSEEDERKNINEQKPLFLDSHYENLIFPKLSRATGSELSVNLRYETPEYLRFKEYLKQSSVVQIGVHVRRGDFVNWLGGSQLLPTTYYKNAILQATTGIGEFKIWIFTDESDSVEDILKLDKNSEKFSSEFQLSDSEELIAFSEMDKVIISRSTFSQWGALMSNGEVYFPSGSQSMTHWIEVVTI
jgi:hypothetical protein